MSYMSALGFSIVVVVTQFGCPIDVQILILFIFIINPRLAVNIACKGFMLVRIGSL